MGMTGMQPGMPQPGSFAPHGAYMTQAGFQQPSAVMNNIGLQNQAMGGMQQPAMMMGAATMPMMGQEAALGMEGEQPVAAAQTAADAVQTEAVGTDKRF